MHLSCYAAWANKPDQYPYGPFQAIGEPVADRGDLVVLGTSSEMPVPDSRFRAMKNCATDHALGAQNLLGSIYESNFCNIGYPFFRSRTCRRAEAAGSGLCG